MATNKVIKEPT